jgi:hypothetical protein
MKSTSHVKIKPGTKLACLHPRLVDHPGGFQESTPGTTKPYAGAATELKQDQLSLIESVTGKP